MKITEDQIPPEVVRAYFEYLWKFPNPTNAEHITAIAAALSAWPGMRISMLFPPNAPHVVFPLFAEKRDE